MKRDSSSITSNLFWKFGERITAQLVSFIVSLVLARVLLPDDYGVVAILMIFINIANVFVSAGLSSALIQKKDADQLDFSTCFYASFILAVIVYGTLFFTAPFISSFYENDSLTIILRIFGLRLLLAPLNSIQQAYVSKQMKFKKFFLATLVGTTISGVVGIYMALNGFGPWALVVQYMLNTTIDTIVLLFTVRWLPSFKFSFKRLKRLWKFGWKIFFEALANEFSGQIRNLIIGKVYTEADLGYYTKAQSFPKLFMTNISASLSAVLFPAMSKIQDDRERLVLLLRKSVRISSYVLFPMLFGLAAVASNMIHVVLTDKWAGAVPFIYIFCFTNLLTVGMYARHEALKSVGRSDIFMIEHIAARVVGIVLLILVYRISVMAIALSGIASGLILTATIMFTSKKFSGYKYTDQIKDVIGLFLMSAIMFSVVFFLGFLPMNKIVLLVLQVIIGVVLYVFLSIVFKPEGFIFVIKLIKRFLPKGKNRTNCYYDDSTSLQISILFIIVVALIPTLFLRYLPLGEIWIFVTQLGVFILSFIFLSFLTKTNILEYLSINIDKIINEYEAKQYGDLNKEETI